MRLLELKDGKVSLTKEIIKDIPPYAILSHTWGEDDEEVTFEDLKQGRGKRKAGFRKILFCTEQANRDGLKYIWIDTCCINKSASAELNEAITSMFSWYRGAVHCYVYLSDVSAGGSGWESAFRKSRWFTRGWTLQELLAPNSVKFFSANSELLGDRNSLDQQIRDITGIPIDALQGNLLSSFSVAARFSWSEKRETKREEDKVYSLMGILGTSLVPNYGEGEEQALCRLRQGIKDWNTYQEDKLQGSHNKTFNAGTFTVQDEPRTIFDLIPQSGRATEIARADVNGRLRRDPDDPSKQFLRFGFHLPSKTPRYFAKFGRATSNDVILPKTWSRNDQCFFDLNPVTEEVLLHDVSSRQNTQLWDKYMTTTLIEHIPGIPGQCVVLLDREWIFVIGDAIFLLKPRQVQDPEALRKEKLSFIHQPVPEEFEGTYEETLHQMSAIDMRSPSVYNTRMNTPFQPELRKVIRYTRLKRLGGGSQGNVYEVVDMKTGDHYACKIIQPKPMPELGINIEKDFRVKVHDQVTLFSKLRHDHILPYLSSQGWGIGHDIEIFQPVCEESFDRQIANFANFNLDESKGKRLEAITKMFHHISLGLHYIHTQDPPIIHRDIKPSNILFRQGKFLLSDFGIAKTVDNSHFCVGTNSYMAPEIWQGGDQTTKVDIYGLGVTIIEALGLLGPLKKKDALWEPWLHRLQTLAANLPFRTMLASHPDKRPTAEKIISAFFHDSLSPMKWARIGSKGPSPKIRLPPQRAIVFRRRKQSVTARTEPAKTINRERVKSQKLGVSSQNKHCARPRSAGLSNQTPRRRRKSSKSSKETTGAGKHPRPRP